MRTSFGYYYFSSASLSLPLISSATFFLKNLPVFRCITLCPSLDPTTHVGPVELPQYWRTTGTCTTLGSTFVRRYYSVLRVLRDVASRRGAGTSMWAVWRKTGAGGGVCDVRTSENLLASFFFGSAWVVLCCESVVMIKREAARGGKWKCNSRTQFKK